MKKLIFITLAVILTFACASHKKATEKVTPTLSKDSTEYELIIFDTHFETWFTINSSEAMKRSNSYYKNQNYLYVIDWNEKYRRGLPFFESYIDYRNDIEYGINFNYKLYMYFKYVENELGVKIRN